jgi:hypothetical protein
MGAHCSLRGSKIQRVERTRTLGRVRCGLTGQRICSGQLPLRSVTHVTVPVVVSMMI